MFGGQHALRQLPEWIRNGARYSSYDRSLGTLNNRVGPGACRAALIAGFCAWALLGNAVDQRDAPHAPNPPSANPAALAAYILGPGDDVVVRCLDAEEFDGKPLRIAADGFVGLPLIGRIQAGGLTLVEFEKQVTDRLRMYIKHPQVSVNVAEFRSQPVTVLGAVSTPGVHYLTGRKTLLEMLSLAGGLKEDAGDCVKLVRKNEWGPIPLASAREDDTGQFSVAELKLRALMNGTTPAENIEIRPYDVISVPRAEIVYVIGEVKKPGGFTLNDRKGVTALEALSMAEGLLRTALARSAKILRRTSDPIRRDEISVNLDDILRGRSADVSLAPDDILFIPNNKVKSAALRTLEAVIQAGTGVLIYGRY